MKACLIFPLIILLLFSEFTGINSFSQSLSVIQKMETEPEMDIYPKTSNEWGFWSFTKPSMYEDVEISGIENVNPLYFSPYLLEGAEQQASLNEEGTAYKTLNEWERQAAIHSASLCSNMNLLQKTLVYLQDM